MPALPLYSEYLTEFHCCQKRTLANKWGHM